MAVVASTAAQVRPVLPGTAEIVDAVAGTSITAGQAVYWNSSGNLVLSSASAAGTAKFAGIALNSVGSGQAVSILKKGHLAGYTLTSLAYGAKLYLSNTAGAVDDTAGTVSVIIGAVVAMSDAARTKVAYFDADWRNVL
jgi:predicted RecA/RadA family phage recombinase